jgi:tetraacyldisaccharide 4'-kinase
MARSLSSVWARAAARTLVRPDVVRADVGVVCVGGATLGGSGKTRVALACVKKLAARGLDVVLIGHAYRAHPRRPRVVGPDDPLAEVGDEALVCARAGARVVVAASRQEAIDHALGLSPDVLVLDGPLRIRGAKVSLLAVDREAPWGSGRTPPAGDLRADREALLACSDHVVEVDATPTSVRWAGSTEERPLGSLSGARLGLFTALARPARLEGALRRAGLTVTEHVSIADHGPVTREAAELVRGRSHAVDLWIATSKCALHLPGTSLAILGSELDLPPSVQLDW